MPKVNEVPYQTRPTKRSVLVARAVPEAIDPKVGSERLGTVLRSFFGQVSESFDNLTAISRQKERFEIEKENREQREAAAAKAMLGEELTEDERKDWDFVDPYNRTRAAKAAAEDAGNWVREVLPSLGLEVDHTEELNTYLRERIKGASNHQYADYYVGYGNEYAAKAIQEHKGNLFVAQKQSLLDDNAARIDEAFRLGTFRGFAEYQQWLTDTARLFGPADASKAKSWLANQLLRSASRAGRMDEAVSVLRMPGTAGDGSQASFAQKFPEAFDKAHKEALDLHTVEYTKAVEGSLHEIDKALVAGDLGSAAVALADHREKFGENSDEFRKRELSIISEITKGADKRAAIDQLTGAVSTGVTPNPEYVEKYGPEVLNAIMASKGVAGVASAIRAWGRVPQEWQKWLETDLVKTDSPESVAATYDTVIGPLFKQAPSLVLRGMSEDAEFVMRYIHDEQAITNKPTLALAEEAARALDFIREQDIKPGTVGPGVFWSTGEEGGKAAFEATLRDKLVDALAPRFKGGVFERLFSRGDVVVPEDTLRTALASAQRHYLRLAASGYQDASSKAVDWVVSTLAERGRLVALPNADGNLVIRPDKSPDIFRDPATGQLKSVAKWEAVTLPDGTRVDPAETFFREAGDERLSFLNDGEPLGLIEGADTQVDGAYDVVDEIGMPLLFAPGQTIEYLRPTKETSVITGTPVPVPGKVKETLTLSTDETEMVRQLTELFGDTGFRLSKVKAQSSLYRLQYAFQPPKRPSLAELEQRHARKAAEKQLHQAMDEEETRRRWADRSLGIIGDGSRLEALKEEVDRGYAAEDAMRDRLYGALREGVGGARKHLAAEVKELVASMQRLNLLPRSIGVTKVIPEFETAEEAWSWLKEQMDRTKLSNGNFPLERSDAKVDDKYAAGRRKFIEINEGRRHTVYTDTQGHPTVGIGFNLDAPHVVDTLKEIGVDVKALKSGKAAMTDEQIDAAFDILVGEAEKIVSNRIKFPLTREMRVALVSMAYQHPNLIGPKLSKAINDGQWDDAIHEIRERSNATGDRGIKFRRDREALMLARSFGKINYFNRSDTEIE